MNELRYRSPEFAPRLSLLRKIARHPAARAVRTALRQRAYPAFCEQLASLGRPLLLSRAIDITSRTATRTCLVLAPHPDDETLGCGATIMRKLAAGACVEVVIASDGRHSHRSEKLPADALAALREEEARRAGSVLGLSPENILFLRFEDGRLADHRQQLRDRLFPIVEQLNPDEIFVSSIIDTHPDHRVLGELGRELARPGRGQRAILYEYPIWFWDPLRWRVRELTKLGVRIVLTEGFLANKHEAVAAYRSQITNLTGEAGWATLRQGFLRHFLQPEEIFFEVGG